MKLHHTYSDGELRPYQTHEWVSRFSNPSADHCYVDIFYQNNIVKEFAMVSCDGGRIIIREPLLPPPDAPVEDTIQNLIDTLRGVDPNLVLTKFMCNLGFILSRYYTMDQYEENLNRVGIEVEDMDDDLDAY